MSHERQVVIGLHLYQPPREATHIRLRHINPDPSGQDWTSRINGQSYEPFIQRCILSRVSFSFFGTLDHALEVIDPDTRDAIRAQMSTNGVADPFIHPLLPDLTIEDKRIVVRTGIRRFTQITGKKPRFLWPPELAIDIPTLEVFAENDIEGFPCASYQGICDDGRKPDNQPIKISLPSGRTILALPIDGTLSHKLAFDDNPDDRDREDAYKFRDRVIVPALDGLRNGFPLLGCTDGETFGHHMEGGEAFMDTLVNHALPQAGVQVISINEVDFNQVTVVEGKIRERTAWSCAHDNLARWRGECDCGKKEHDIGWRRPFYQALHDLNWEMTKIVQAKLGEGYLDLMVDNFDKAFKNPGSQDDIELSLISAKVSGLTALTSCGTFYEDPGVSGNINILFARQAVEHLKDAGLAKKAAEVWTQFLTTMQEVHNPAYYNRNGIEMAHDLLGEIAYDGYLPIAA